MGPNRQIRVNNVIGRYDPTLYVKVDHEVPCVYKKTYRYETYNCGGVNVTYPIRDDSYIFALTDTYSPSGQVVEFGIEKILEHIQEIDGYNRQVFKEIMERQEKLKEMQDRQETNEIEDFMRDFRPKFVKAHEDVNISCMDKLDKRRLFDGYRK